MKDLGDDECGYSENIPVSKNLLKDSDDTLALATSASPVDDAVEVKEPSDERLKCTVHDIIEVHLLRRQPKVNKTVWDEKKVKVTNATGSSSSIREWSKAAFGKDKKSMYFRLNPKVGNSNYHDAGT